MKTLSIVAIAAALAAAPALTQPAPPAAPGLAQGEARAPARGPRPHQMQRWGNMSPEGQRLVMEAMRGSMHASDRQALRTARERVTVLVAQPQLDVAQLRQAMAEERRLVDQMHARRQEAMIQAFQRLSAEDRQAFADDARQSRERVRERVRGGQGASLGQPVLA